MIYATYVPDGANRWTWQILPVANWVGCCWVKKCIPSLNFEPLCLEFSSLIPEVTESSPAMKSSLAPLDLCSVVNRNYSLIYVIGTKLCYRAVVSHDSDVWFPYLLCHSVWHVSRRRYRNTYLTSQISFVGPSVCSFPVMAITEGP